jgi:uncharacterized protein DUF5753
VPDPGAQDAGAAGWTGVSAGAAVASATVPDWFEIYVGLEAEAATISAYDAEFVPGLLQTEEYARAVHRARLLRANEEEIEQRVRMRMARQELLISDDAPQVWLVLNEAVIRRLVGGRATMHAQLTHLIEAACRT